MQYSVSWTTSSLGMDWITCNNSLTVSGEIVRSTDSIISKFPVVPSELSSNEKSIVQGAIICISDQQYTSYVTTRTYH